MSESPLTVAARPLLRTIRHAIHRARIPTNPSSAMSRRTTRFE